MFRSTGFTLSGHPIDTGMPRGVVAMSQMMGTADYAIAAVSKLTGVSCHALRVWERRYGFPVPHRSASGHRRYTPDQVWALRTISERAQTGRPIGELIAEYREGRFANSEPATENAVAEEQGS